MKFLSIADQMRPLLHRSDEEIADELGCAPKTVKMRRREVDPDYQRKGWARDREELLAKLWNDGLNASQIAVRLGTTKNAVIGKARRLSLPFRRDSGNLSAKARGGNVTRLDSLRSKTNQIERSVLGDSRESYKRGRKPGSRVPLLPADPLPPPHVTDIPRKTFLELGEADCKFVCLPEAAGPFVKQFCGEPRVKGLPYCGAHARRAFQPPTPRKPAASAPAPVAEPVLEVAA